MFQLSKLCIWTVLVSAIFLHLQLLTLANGKNYYYEVERLTSSQRKALDAFKSSMLPLLTKNFMKEDIFLLKYLEYNEFDIAKSKEQLKETLKWRSDNNVDELLANPPDYFTALYRDYPIFNDGFDKEGRPICEVAGGVWPIRTAAVGGYLKNITLHMEVNCAERASVRLREQQDKGINVTQWIVLINMDGFSLAEHACPSCIPFSVNLVMNNDMAFPNSSYGFWLINTPGPFSVLLNIFQPLMSLGAKDALKIFTSDKSEWKPFLEEHVDFNEISDWYGGAKVRKSGN